MNKENRIRILEAKLKTNTPPPSIPVVFKLKSCGYSWKDQKYASADDVPGSEHGIVIIETVDGRNETQEG